MEGTGEMKWNLRLAAANRGIWKASELQRLLAERGMVISAGKMSGLWSGQPNTVKLDELDVICAVLGCDVGSYCCPSRWPCRSLEPARAPALSRKLALSRPGSEPAGPCRPGDRAIRMRMAARAPAAFGWCALT
jgi:DNA-binding Xre family transcriptional regulator